MILFVIVVLVFWLSAAGAWWMWSSGRQKADLDRIKARLAGAPETRRKPGKPGQPMLIQPDGQGQGRLLLELLRKLRLAERLNLLFEQAGLKWNVTRTLHGSLALFLLAFTGVWHVAPLYRLAALPAGLAAGALPLLYVVRRRKARLRAFEQLFPESLEFLSRSMRAGHAFSVSLEMIHSEFQEPLAGEFRRTFEEQNLGLPLDVALEKLAQRVPLMDVHFFVSAVLLQKRTGGNLAELLDKLATLIRERFKLRGRIRAISAHGRMTGMALTSIPIGVGVIMWYVNPMYAQFFIEDPTGHLLLGGAVALQLIGYGVIKKIVSIEV